MEPSFAFPFKPYPIQETFMRELYLTIEHGKLGIFESPTGTGKSLSICCGALQWLKDYNKKTLENVQNEIAQLQAELASIPASEDWLQEEYDKINKTQTLLSLQSKLEQLKQHNNKLNEIKLRVAKAKSNVNNKSIGDYFQNSGKNKVENYVISENTNNQEEIENEEDRDLLLEEVEEEEDQKSDEEDATEDKIDSIKLYISSRTHSQLSQFVGEIKRTAYSATTRVVALASRQHYCINGDVNKLPNVHLINERCLDLQKCKSRATTSDASGRAVKKARSGAGCGSCPYYNHNNISRLRDRLLTDVMDMEDLVRCGRQLTACPYYAARMALQHAELVLVSHAGLVSSGARSGLSLRLPNNVVIVDEAHGLSAALESAHSAPVTDTQLTAVKASLQLYVNKYRPRLSSRNLLALNQISFIVGKLLGMIKPCPDDNKCDEAEIMTLQEFVIKAEIDHMNLRPLVEFCRTTRLPPKLHGFSMRYSQTELEEEMTKSEINKKSSFESFLKNISKSRDTGVTDTEDVQPQSQSVRMQSVPAVSAGSGLYAILHLLEMLCARSDDGRVLARRAASLSHGGAAGGGEGERGGMIKYLLLNPAERFADIVAECRSVIVAGGTMEPISEFRTLLAATPCDNERVNVVRCDHVVPPDNVLAVCLSKGPSNVALNYCYEHRMDKELLQETGCILRNVCSVTQGGVVCFLPSYAYERVVYTHMLASGVIGSISRRKAVFREPVSAARVDAVLSAFAAAATDTADGRNGALLLSVVGGKLSEGLNFSDELGRCVLVVGMPYPNKHSPELVEKMSYLERSAGSGAGNRHYETLCIKAVNQCIGRAVRHANDYACVLLLDERYSKPHTIAALPSFVTKSLTTNCTFGPAIGSMAKFFTKHKNKS